jgi:formamidopyrimidine-DNA glycosylase
MLEIPESFVIAKQINEALTGKSITKVVVKSSPHKFAWFIQDGEDYGPLLSGKTVTGAQAIGGQVEIWVADARIVFTDGVNLRYLKKEEDKPEKHQLYLEFDDGSALVASVQMYGGLLAFRDGENQNPYYLVAKEKPSPLTEAFDETYFQHLIDHNLGQKLSLKAFLATEQRIPGLGNGVLQDILFCAGLHPKRKLDVLNGSEIKLLFQSVKSTLKEMADRDGRNTEKDIYGQSGNYVTLMSSKTASKPCPVCGHDIIKETYLGGSIYYCEHCQPCK